MSIEKLNSIFCFRIPNYSFTIFKKCGSAPGITEAKKNIKAATVGTGQVNAEEGPGDQPVIITPPK
jgi:hypothetical protein